MTTDPGTVHSGFSLLRRNLAWLTAFLTVSMLVMGTLVTGTIAGDSVPDWPLAFGTLVPINHISGLVIFEYFHRVNGFLIGLSALTLAIVAIRTDKRRWARNLAMVVFLAVVVQGCIGGVRVLTGTAEYAGTHVVATIHATFAHLTLGTLTILGLVNTRSWFARTVLVPGQHTQTPILFLSRPIRVLSHIGSAAVALQIFLAAAYRHSVFALNPHLIWAFITVSIISAAGIWAIRDTIQSKGDKWLVGPSLFIALFIYVQMSLGFVAELLWAKAIHDKTPGGVADIAVAAAHTVLATLLFTATLWLQVRIRWLLHTGRAVLKGAKS